MNNLNNFRIIIVPFENILPQKLPLILCENYAKCYAVQQGQSGLLQLAIVFQAFQWNCSLEEFLCFETENTT